MIRLRLLLLLLPVALFQVGCASNEDSSPSAGNIDANGNAVSSTPWNKPESWETGGTLGNAIGN
jgi:hypothetical protein